MARSILSFGMLSARAARTAARRRGFMAGSGRPSLAATVISRESLPKTFERTASCRPLRCMMFLNCEWPATAVSPDEICQNAARVIGSRRDKIQNAARGTCTAGRWDLHVIGLRSRKPEAGIFTFDHGAHRLHVRLGAGRR